MMVCVTCVSERTRSGEMCSVKERSVEKVNTATNINTMARVNTSTTLNSNKHMPCTDIIPLFLCATSTTCLCLLSFNSMSVSVNAMVSTEKKRERMVSTCGRVSVCRRGDVREVMDVEMRVMTAQTYPYTPTRLSHVRE